MTMEEGARLDRDQEGRANRGGRPAMSEPAEALRECAGVAVRRRVAAACRVDEESASCTPEAFREKVGRH